jgi:hypothetical protein
MLGIARPSILIFTIRENENLKKVNDIKWGYFYPSSREFLVLQCYENKFRFLE